MNNCLWALVPTFVLLSLLFFCYWYSRNSQLRADEFETAVAALLYLVRLYRGIHQKKVEQLKKKYDLDPNSPTNAAKVYLEELDKLTAASVRMIINALSGKTYRTLLKYYSADALLIIIKENLG